MEKYYKIDDLTRLRVTKGAVFFEQTGYPEDFTILVDSICIVDRSIKRCITQLETAFEGRDKRRVNAKYLKLLEYKKYPRTRKRYAELLDVDPRTVSLWIKRGFLEPNKIHCDYSEAYKYVRVDKKIKEYFEK